MRLSRHEGLDVVVVGVGVDRYKAVLHASYNRVGHATKKVEVPIVHVNAPIPTDELIPTNRLKKLALELAIDVNDQGEALPIDVYRENCPKISRKQYWVLLKEYHNLVEQHGLRLDCLRKKK
jgi:hypothetical protein